MLFRSHLKANIIVFLQFELGPVFLEISLGMLYTNISKTVICLEAPAKILPTSVSLPVNKLFFN